MCLHSYQFLSINNINDNINDLYAPTDNREFSIINVYTVQNLPYVRMIFRSSSTIQIIGTLFLIITSKEESKAL